jgi:excisionase family DNA binding protein
MEAITIPQYSLKHAAHMIGVSDKTVRRWMHSGKIGSYRIGGRRSLYTDLDEINKMRELYALPILTVDESVVIYKNY